MDDQDTRFDPKLGDAPSPREDSEPSASRRLRFANGTAIDRYVILAPLGRGGMGEVYKAYDQRLDRAVALKFVVVPKKGEQRLIKLRSRLLREAQVLAKLSHPNVVTVHDVNTYQDDVFVAMELVEGKTLKHWLRDMCPFPRQILQVLSEAGRGLAAAHRAGIIHRDFKPGNLIVATDGRARVLDFGVARISQPSRAGASADDTDAAVPALPRSALTESGREVPVGAGSAWQTKGSESPITAPGGIVGTFAYMSPEQMLGYAVDGRSDQYSFCLVLYEALCGQMPFEAVKEVDLVLGRLARQAKPFPPGCQVPERVQQIVRRGLSSDPNERYPDLDALLDDLEQATREPADHSSLRRRFLLTAALLAFTLVGFLGFGLWTYRNSQLCKGADRSFEGIWDPASKRAVRERFEKSGKKNAQVIFGALERELDGFKTSWISMHQGTCEATHLRGVQSERMLDLKMSCLGRKLQKMGALVEVFRDGADPGMVDRALQATSVLDDLVSCADEEALTAEVPPPRDATVLARVKTLRTQLDRVEALRLSGKVQDGLSLARNVTQEALSVAYPVVHAEALYHLGNLEDAVGDYPSAESTLARAAQIAASAKDTRLSTQAWIQAMWVVGYQQGKYVESLALAHSAEMTLVLGRDDPQLRGALLAKLGDIHNRHGHYPEAEEALKHSLELQQKNQSSNRPAVAATLVNLGNVYYHQEKIEEARRYYQEALGVFEKTLGSEHPDLAIALCNLGGTLKKLGSYEEAQKLYERALAIQERALGMQHPDVAVSLSHLAEVYDLRGEYEKAKQLYERALAIDTATLGDEHPKLVVPLGNLGSVFTHLGQFGEALALYERALSIQERVLPANHPDLAVTLQNIGAVYESMGEGKKAIRSYERALTIEDGSKPDRLSVPIDILLRLGDLMTSQEDTRQARVHYERAHQLERARVPSDPPELASTLSKLAELDRLEGKLPQAERGFERALQLEEQALGPEHPELAMPLLSLGQVLLGQDRFAEALKIFERAHQLTARTLDEKDPKVAMALSGMADCLSHLDRGEEASKLLDRAARLVESPEESSLESAEICFALARSFMVSDSDRERAVLLARKAREIYRQSPAPQAKRQLARVQKWLGRYAMGG